MKANNEKQLAWDLDTLDIPYYLPMVRRESNLPGITTQDLCPLLTGTLFVAGSDQNRYRVLTTSRVQYIEQVDDQKQLLEDLQAVRRILGHSNQIEVLSERVTGQHVRVTQGPYEGLQGAVTGPRPWDRVTVTLESLCQSLSISVKDDALHPLDD